MSWRRLFLKRSGSVLLWIVASAWLVHLVQGAAQEVSRVEPERAGGLARSGALFLTAGVALPLLCFLLNWGMLRDAPALFAHRRRGVLGRWSFGGRPLEPRDWAPLRSGHSRRREARRELLTQMAITSACAVGFLLLSGVRLHGWWLASALAWSGALCGFFFAGAAWAGRAGLLALAFFVGPLLLSARGGLPLAASSDLALAVRRLWGLVPQSADGAYLAALAGAAAVALLLSFLGQAAVPR